MSESEWLACTDPGPMLECLRGRADDRKLRLFAVACCRRVWPLLADGRSRRAVEVAERYADEEADEEDLRLAVIGAENVADAFAGSSATAGQQAQASAAFAALNATAAAPTAADYSSANAASAAYHAATAAGAPSAAGNRSAERGGQARLLRDLFGPLGFRRVTVDPGWGTSDVLALARAAYEERILPAGTLDSARLALLADALEEAGCDSADLLAHLRGAGPHVRGCWALDLLLGKA